MINGILASNIAWSQQDDNEVLQFLSRIGINKIELSPYRDDASLENAYQYVKTLQKYSIQPYSMQAIQYRQPVYSIFNLKDQRKLLLQLTPLINFAKDVGIKRIVFGCPKNRAVISKNTKESDAIASQFFTDLAKQLQNSEVVLCIEPVPEIYKSKFLTNTRQTIDFVEKLNNECIKINFDLGSAIINNEDIENLFKTSAHLFGHVHISEPYLKPVPTSKEFHIKTAATIRNSAYQGHVAIEMLPEKSANVEGIIESLVNIYQN